MTITLADEPARPTPAAAVERTLPDLPTAVAEVRRLATETRP